MGTALTGLGFLVGINGFVWFLTAVAPHKPRRWPLIATGVGATAFLIGVLLTEPCHDVVHLSDVGHHRVL